MTVIGTLKELWRYPVKSMRGEELKEAFVNYSGLTGDRIYAFVATGKEGNFPWHTAREQHDLLLYYPSFKNELSLKKQYPNRDEFSVSVRTPEGEDFDIEDPKLLALLKQRSGADFYLRFSEKGMQDARPLSLISYDSVENLSGVIGEDLDPLRFRANFYVSWANQEAFHEDSLVDKNLLIGEKLEVRVVKKDPRCKIINLDPNTAVHNPLILQNVAKHRRGCIGVYLAVIREGEVKAGDEIKLL